MHAPPAGRHDRTTARRLQRTAQQRASCTQAWCTVTSSPRTSYSPTRRQRAHPYRRHPTYPKPSPNPTTRVQLGGTSLILTFFNLTLTRFSRTLKSAGQMMETVCGTHHYLAPELVRCDRGEISCTTADVGHRADRLHHALRLQPFPVREPPSRCIVLHRSAYKSLQFCASNLLQSHALSLATLPVRLHPATRRLQARQQHADATGHRRLSVHLS